MLFSLGLSKMWGPAPLTPSWVQMRGVLQCGNGRSGWGREDLAPVCFCELHVTLSPLNDRGREGMSVPWVLLGPQRLSLENR